MMIMDKDILNWLFNGLCLLLGLLIGIGIGGCIEDHRGTAQFEKVAIQHNAGQYNPTTGKFEWLDKSIVEKE